jgi:hypothetical protein
MHSFRAKNMNIKHTYLWAEELKPMQNERAGLKIRGK